ncbi:methyltransferase domain-containing protein [Pseudolysinimonas sp.]|uniref:methyltransferase domain-containing protein n=1 Tax=Pseudolysinimonas sp. TaxID=2680009 RepID=UPI003F813687
MTTEPDPLVAALRSVGCVFAEAEAAEIRRVLRDPDAQHAVVSARAAGMPLEQALGRARFAGMDVELAPGVFVPRARAETIVDVAVRTRPRARLVADLGTGNGAIAAALVERLPLADVHATDLDPAAVAVATRNGDRVGFSVRLGDWWEGLPPSLRGRVDLATAYLPHVPTERLDHIPRDFREHEPELAVHGGADGLDPLRAVLAGMAAWLAPGGAFVTLVAGEQVETARGLGERVDVVETDDDAVLVFERVRR